MTSGEPELETVVENIVGRENLFTTEIPIEIFPTTLRGGIRCMIGEVPKGLLKI